MELYNKKIKEIDHNKIFERIIFLIEERNKIDQEILELKNDLLKIKEAIINENKHNKE